MAVSFSVYYQNCRGLRTKTTEFLLSSWNCSAELICVTESWLKPAIDNSEFICSNYNVYRRDRSDTASSKREGGGVFIGVAKRLQSVAVSNCLHSTLIEDLWIKINLSGTRNLFVGVCYIPPGTSSGDYLTYFNAVTALMDESCDDHFLLLGDFNLPRFSWIVGMNGDVLCDMVQGDSYTEFRDFTSYNSLGQFNSQLNRNGKILDFVLSSSSAVITKRSLSPFVVEDVKIHFQVFQRGLPYCQRGVVTGRLGYIVK